MPFNFKDSKGDRLAEIHADSEPLKRALQTIDVAEAKLFIDQSSLSSRWVDPANVYMGEVNIPTDALGHTVIDGDGVVGMPVGDLEDALQPARLGADDNVQLTINQRQAETWVDRAYGEGQSTYHDAWRLLDPDSIRQEPDLPELDLPTKTTLSATQFHDAIHAVAAKHDHIELATTDETLEVRPNKVDTSGREVSIEADPDAEVASIYSKDYLKDIADSLKSADPEHITISLGDEMPIIVTWARADGISGKFMQAPRIQSD